MNYAALREGGMELIRKWASQSWTDHNIHDPGITILEASSYAMTELGLRLQQDVADLLRSGESIRTPDLVPADRVLPVGPVTPQDLRSVLLDHRLVRDAQISLPADGEVLVYGPPLTYTPGLPRVRPGGLYEVLVELADSDLDQDLNSNTYSLKVASGGQNYDVDLALPYWDDPEAAVFRAGAVVTGAAMVLDAGEAWRALPEPQSFFGKIDISYILGGVPDHVVSWIVLRITTVLPSPGLVPPAVLVDARTAVESIAPGPPAAPIIRFAARAGRAAADVGQLKNYLAGWRSLGEQAVRIGVPRVQEIAVRARIEVTGGIDVEQLLANIFVELDSMLSPRVRFEALTARLGTQSDSDVIYDGPLLRNGFLASDSLNAPHPSVLFLSDVLRVIMRQRTAAGTDVVTQENPAGRDIVAVTDLALTNFINNLPITSNADDCLTLVEVQRYRPRLSIAKSRFVLVRNDSEVSYDIGRVEQLVATAIGKLDQESHTTNPSSVWPVTVGDRLPIDEYTPLQEELPAVYGVGQSELPDSAGVSRRAGVRQLQGYLLLFEQILADVTTQLVNVNRFFSGDSTEDTTYFTRPPFDLPGVSNLLRRFTPGGSTAWATFVADPNNPVAAALHAAAEDRTDMLDRRNRMLDHLLARQGEDMVAFGQELHRWAQLELRPDQQASSIASRRDAANARLVRIKAALLRDAPELHALRLLANSNPLFRDPALLQITQDGIRFRWHLTPGNQERLRSTATFTTAADASIDAESAMAFAARSSLYQIVIIAGGQRRLNVIDGSTPVHVVAETPQTFADDPTATAAAAELASLFARLRIESSASPFERLVAHQTGIRDFRRRPLQTAINVNFQIVDDPPGGGLFGKRWRLFELPGNTGQVLLNSPQRYDAATDAAAVQKALDSIRQVLPTGVVTGVLRYGMDEWNYVIPPAAPLTYELNDPSGVVLGRRDTPLASTADVAPEIEATAELLYRSYSGEGFCLIEHLLLRPQTTVESFLSLPVPLTQPVVVESDPYSQRISLVFPSGYTSDFSVPRNRVPTTPDRFRDLEFRNHAERVIQQACPAHLRPTVYWVDRANPGSPLPLPLASFDTFEERYFNWLDTVLIPGAPATTVDAARAALVETLNAIANDTP
jgi:hypothetical protein